MSIPTYDCLRALLNYRVEAIVSAIVVNQSAFAATNIVFQAINSMYI